MILAFRMTDKAEGQENVVLYDGGLSQLYFMMSGHLFDLLASVLLYFR